MGIAESCGADTNEIELGGNKYILSPLSINDLGAMENEIKNRSRAEIKSIAEDAELKGIDKANYIKSELDKIDILKYMGSLDGVSLAIYYSIKKKHPEIKREEIAEKITSENMNEIADKISGVISGETKNEQRQVQENL